MEVALCLEITDQESSAPVPSHRTPLQSELSMTDSTGTPLLTPVSLDPGWESLHAGREVLTFTIHQNLDQMTKEPPPDRCCMVYIILFIHGISLTLPWTAFLLAKSYFEDYRLNITPYSLENNYTTDAYAVEQSLTAHRFGVCAWKSGLAVMFFMAIMGMILRNDKVHASARIVISVSCQVVSVTAMVILAMLDSEPWTAVLFWVSIGAILLLNGSTGFLMTSLLGMAALFPVRYISAVVTGMNFGFVISGCVLLVTSVLAANPRTAAIYHFVFAIVGCAFAISSYFILPHMRYYKHYRRLSDLRWKQLEEMGQKINIGRCRSNWNTFRTTLVQAFSVWFTYFTTFAIFPGVLMQTPKLDPYFAIPGGIFWTAIVCFLLFGSICVCGSVTTIFIRKPAPNITWLVTLIRGLAVFPVVLLCNYRPDTRTVPVYIPSDVGFIVAMVYLALTHGYLGSLTVAHGPTWMHMKVASENSTVGAMVMAVAMAFGIMTGVCFTSALDIIVDVAGTR